MVMPLLYILHQPVAVDAKDSDGHTALMWAAYQGDAISLDLLLHHSASPHTRDNSGLTPLHWAVVKGNKVCIRRLIEAGAELDVKDEQGKTPRDMAEELKSLGAWKKGLEESGRKEDGRVKIGVLSERNTKIAIFCLPTIFGYLIITTLKLLPWYTGTFLAMGEFYLMHHIITRVLLDYKGTGDTLAKSPYFASIIVASMVWVGQAWATRLVYHTPGYAFYNLLFFISYVVSVYNFIRAVTLDAGTAPKPSSDAELKEIIEDLTGTGRFNGTNFCIICMAKKPLRSKHCRIDNKCTARFDHHCPWVWNCVGVHNHRQFLLFITSLLTAIVLFDILTFQYFLETAPTWTPETGAPCILPSVLCTATGYDTHLFAIAAWSTLQLTWTSILVVGQIWQVAKQMTTLEVSNLGRYGFMGGRGGSSLRDQSGAMVGVGGGSGGGGMSLDPTGVDEPDVDSGEGIGPPLGGVGDHAGHNHGPGGGGGKNGGGGGMSIGGKMGFMLQILGLDRFTKGKAARGLALAGKDQNPFDQGIVRNCGDFWTAGGGLQVDYTQLYEIPNSGFDKREMTSSMKLPSFSTGRGGRGGGYEPVRTSLSEDV
ncbi:DHHC palmitoyltransferase-domain-containing protein [Mrakia frigida]|uniref:ankyrin repeat domain-containing DHHC palmitoyltransferase family protein n=1 Tax=Mrakia frigida TaxID=29902 RepID=UPI003FCC12A5